MPEDLLALARRLEGECACGRRHALQTRALYSGGRVPGRLRALAGDLAAGGQILCVYDATTKALAGPLVSEALRGLPQAEAILLGDEIHADERALGQILLRAGEKTALLLAVGSGTVNDSTRLVAHRLKLPYLVLGTAPSMDGYASSVSPVLDQGMKITYEAVAPEAVLFDEGILAAAPRKMVAAGLGDMLGKHIALLDWELSQAILGESRCEAVFGLMSEALARCEKLAPGLAAGEEGAAARLAEGLTLSGLAMQMMGNSRPASGAEHHIAHFLEMRQLLRGEKPSLHGDKVGVATLFMIEFYQKLFQKRREAKPVDLRLWEARLRRGYGPLAGGFLRAAPLEQGEGRTSVEQYEGYLRHFDGFAQKAAVLAAKREDFAQMLEAAGGPSAPEGIGATRQDMKDAMLCAFLLRPRYSALRMAFRLGVLEEIAEEIFA
ncbi:MAG: sn-glycerol-1-phosphate dehydrogenase [Christensenellaceae bacterium]|jgi:glycerol-1-phosphate dehydrogenase [NAD(P)+]|nr:sn-glycerol-1-phosphate dehydrogenase [Christensenellaceae bacterium]